MLQTFVNSAMASKDHAEYMREQRHKPIPILHQLKLLLYAKEPWLCALFEGSAETHFYYPEIRRRGAEVGRKTDKFFCDSKDGVIYIFKELNKELKTDSRVLFFVDKDLDDLLKKDNPSAINFFITSFYSIENYLVNAQALEIFWSDFLKKNHSDNEFQFILERYETAYNAFVEIVKKWMIWTFLCKEKGHSIYLNSIKLKEFKKLFKINNRLELAYSDAGFDYFKELTKTSDLRISEDEMSAVSSVFLKLEFKKYIRGKYEFYFFILFCCAIKTYLQEKNAKSVKEEPSESSILNLIANRISLPSDLKSFLDSNFENLKLELKNSTCETESILEA